MPGLRRLNVASEIEIINYDRLVVVSILEFIIERLYYSAGYIKIFIKTFLFIHSTKGANCK